jgi:arginine N-succinyltransferase
MLLFRPSRLSDLPGLLALAGSASGGLTTLPAKEDVLHERIEDSQRGFNTRVKRPGGESYLFVLEETDTGAVVGTSGLSARVGGFEPFYTYEVKHDRFSHPPLGIEKEVAVLHLKKIHRGPSELCSLLLHSGHRRSGAGRLLSLARFHFMHACPERFDATVIAELRGYVDQEGKSPFWEAVGRPFFENEFFAVDYLSGLGDKSFIADLMPEHPIYTNLLPASVRAVLGRVHPDTEPALALLLAEGFERTNEIDIFDAGPVLRAATAQVRTIRTCRTARVRSLETPEGPHPASLLVSNLQLDFRACLAPLWPHEDNSVSIAPAVAAALQLEPGHSLAFSPLR